MRIKVNEKENDICKKHILNYLLNNLKLKESVEYIKKEYPSFCVNNMEVFDVINDCYIDETKYDNFKQIINDINVSYDYVINNIKDLVLTNLSRNKLYYPKLNDNDPILENFVKNGTLVLRMNRNIDFTLNPKLRIKATNDINDYIKSVEEDMTKKLGLDVRILFNDISFFDINKITK